MPLVPYRGVRPDVSPQAWIAPDATLIGALTVAESASVWYAAVVRADGDRIEIGAGSNVQDGCVLHADPGAPLRLGADVSVGHNTTLHGCTVDDTVLVGMGATVLNHARIGTGSLVAAGSVILEGTEIPPRSLVAGVPAKVRRQTTDEEVELIAANAEHYRRLSAEYAAEGDGSES